MKTHHPACDAYLAAGGPRCVCKELERDASWVDGWHAGRKAEAEIARVNHVSSKRCLGCGNPYDSPGYDQRCSSCAESGTGPDQCSAEYPSKLGGSWACVLRSGHDGGHRDTNGNWPPPQPTEPPHPVSTSSPSEESEREVMAGSKWSFRGERIVEITEVLPKERAVTWFIADGDWHLSNDYFRANFTHISDPPKAPAVADTVFTTPNSTATIRPSKLSITT